MKGICIATFVAVTLLVGCSPLQGSSPADDECTSRYEPVANAPTRAALKQNLLRAVDPRVRSLRVIDEDPSDDKVVVNLVSRRNRLVMSLDMWQKYDGTWTAQQWSQCID